MDEKQKSTEVYEATSESLSSVVEAHPYYALLSRLFQEGEGNATLRKRFMLKMVDEDWIQAIEDALPSIDVIIRSPGVSLIDQEEVLPIELTKKVTSRSVQHLAQHTDLINEINADGMVFPSKLLNVYQDETPLTYENRFINTLILRVYSFVMIRYDAASQMGQDLKNTEFSYDQSFTNGDKRGTISIKFSLSEPPKENETVKANYIYTSDLWKRLEKIVAMIKSHMGSPFVKMMGKNYVKPPIMRTNKLLKNVDFNNCLKLWEYLEQYDNTGYEMLVQENLDEFSDDAMKEIVSSVMAQYVIFENHIQGEIAQDGDSLDSRLTNVFKPKFKEELDKFDEEEYAYEDLREEITPEELDSPEGEEKLDKAIQIALMADEFFVGEETAEETAVYEKGQVLFQYQYSFLARLILDGELTQAFYTHLKNKLCSYEKVKDVLSWNHERFSLKRNTLCLMKIRGKSLYCYLPLDPKEYAGTKYKFTDLSGKKSGQKLPMLVKVRSQRSLRHALKLIEEVMRKYSLAPLDEPVETQYVFEKKTVEEMVCMEPALIRKVAPKRNIFSNADDDLPENEMTPEEETAEAETEEVTEESIEESAETVETTEESIEEPAETAETTEDDPFIKPEVIEETETPETEAEAESEEALEPSETETETESEGTSEDSETETETEDSGNTEEQEDGIRVVFEP